ncbi:N-formylglutamate amidohydrolase [Ancylobacter mangrovi]|uniref:N-formylglutamate amidohydrolase n=1 Tax=Ancylobacter mangrovi TaxID=2972472 RepID=UPI0021628421|nr:N-formylglutamate amidohydrolase [Ancylobacter mangrovi]MCS0503844.1 N-formylglutamate amidohydrolase [Ancylobacter mangrovi]
MRRLSREDRADDHDGGRDEAATIDDPTSFPAFEVIPGAAEAGLLLICDHASNALPAAYDGLGLPPGELERHIGYDIGVAGVTRRLAATLGCSAVLSHFSRLLIDPNRGEDDPTLVMRLSDGAVIPGNRHADADEVESRLALFHRPYHAAIEAEIARALAAGTVPAILSVHSFTPVWRGVPRPWHVALLWDADPRFTAPLLEALRAPGDLIVGDNEPYDGALRNDCLYRHGTSRGLAHTLIEIRQDLIGDEAGQQAWADRLAGLLPAILAEPLLHERRAYGSRTGPVPPIYP